MIVHNITPSTNVKRPIVMSVVKTRRRVKKIKTITKTNKDFLRSLGFKL